MAELTFVGLAVLVWIFIVCLVIAAAGTVALTFHVVHIEIRHFRRVRRMKHARLEMEARQAAIQRKKEQQVKDAQFFAEIEGIRHGL